MELYLIVKTIHIVSSAILFGTGIGIAFFMFQTYCTDNIYEKSYAVRNTVLADYIFTAPAVLLQPATGFWLVWQGGYGWSESWLVSTYIIYIIAGLCWLPVVWIQIRLKNIIAESVQRKTALPPRYYTLFKAWFILGWPAFIGLVVVFFLMVFKPT